MAKQELIAAHPLGGVQHTGSGTEGLWVHIGGSDAVASVAARQGRSHELADRIMTTYGIEMPRKPSVVRAGKLGFVGTGPAHWLLIDESGAQDFAQQLALTLKGVGSVCDQSDGLVVLRLGGPDLYQTLARGAQLDFHPSAFPADAAATTVIGHIGATLWRCPDVQGHPSVAIAIFRSLSVSFWHWLEAAAEGSGISVRKSP